MEQTVVVPLECPIDPRVADAVVADLVDRPVRVVLLAVVRLPQPSELPYDQRLRGANADTRELQAFHGLHALSARLRAAGRTITTVVSWGPLPEAVSALARGYDAELLLPEFAAAIPSSDPHHLLSAVPYSRTLRVPLGRSAVR